MNKCYPGSLYGTREDRKAAPMVSGLLWYFPDALAAVAHVSVVGNDQHNPGEPLHDARGKSNDDLDCAVRHLTHAGTLDSDKVRHTAKLAWRALRALQKELEEAHGLPLPRNARFDDAWMGVNVPVESSYVGIGFGAETYIPDPNLPAHVLRRVERPLPYADWHSACGGATSEAEITEAIEGIVAEAEQSRDDGWIEWKHGSRVPRELVDIKFQDGSKVHGIAPAIVNWWSNDLVAWRYAEAAGHVSPPVR